MNHDLEPARFVKSHKMSNENTSHMERSESPVNREVLRAVAHLLWQLHEHHVNDHHSSDEETSQPSNPENEHRHGSQGRWRRK